MELHNNTNTKDQINTSCSMNTLGISFTYVYASEIVKLNWFDIFFAINNGYLNYQSAIEHARNELENNDTYSHAVLNLACLSVAETIFPHIIHPFIDELINQTSEKEKSEAKDKIMYVLLKWVYDHKTDYDDPLSIVEYVYDDFGFPETIISFVRYLPMQGPNLGSRAKNTARLFDNWESFLSKQQEKWHMI
jgi:hypothetical protein